MIDALGIFDEIKNEIQKLVPEIDVYAFGSRCRGHSRTNKWDFDVLIGTESSQVLLLVSHHIKEHFSGRIDEFGKPVRIDVFRTRANNLEQQQKTLKNAVLL